LGRHGNARRWADLQGELTRWLSQLPKPLGLMACNDVRARHVLEACRTLGLRVPHDVAVIGVDNDSVICDLTDPSLSSIDQSARRIGYAAAEMLDRLMQGADAPTQRLVVPPIGVVARRSTDTLAVEDPAVARVIRTIRERAFGPLAIADLVAESGLSRWQVEERFRHLVGRSIRDDILEVRLAEARRLVTTTDLPLKTIAPRAGFRSIAYMTTVFRRHFGTTPAALRAAAQGSQ
jgi:LacI family transcriptional regulator